MEADGWLPLQKLGAPQLATQKTPRRETRQLRRVSSVSSFVLHEDNYCAASLYNTLWSFQDSRWRGETGKYHKA